MTRRSRIIDRDSPPGGRNPMRKSDVINELGRAFGCTRFLEITVEKFLAVVRQQNGRAGATADGK